ncbi:deoxyribonuclease IV [Tautonia marina]|uniref:deoxyribonuclease IV n=1 Tax=Tautonia marina TaxID=2653855 RepID=UPI0021BCB217|nr:deoxyribonuclease IV [Tautonia marina]
MFGAHMSIAGGHDRAVRAAAALGMDCVQIFTKSNNQWKAKPLTDDQVAAFRQSLSETGVGSPVAHNSYLINLASPDDELWHKSIDAMVIELERAEALGIRHLVSHPGAHVGSGEEAGLTRIAAGLDEIHRRTTGFQARIALETTAGQGSCLGHRFEHLSAILDQVHEADRLEICVDTCHIFAAGYRLGTRDEYNETIGELDRIIGLKRVRVWHLNDSVKACGSRVDRHAGIGRGELGLEPFAHIVADPRFATLPMILETPKGTEGGEDLDAINLRVLRDLETRARLDAADASRTARAS